MTTRRIATFATLLLLTASLAHEAEAGPRSRPVRTGQTTCWDSAGAVIACAGTGQDGDLKAGEPRSYVDNGDGTIRDKRTGLTWEKLSDDGTIHDKNNLYIWADAFGKIDALNTAAFAGFADWRLPNRSELESIVNIGTVNPAVSPAFDTGCIAGCTVLTCNCTVFSDYWSSSTFVVLPEYAWHVDFGEGFTGADPKDDDSYVRAVRGGS